MTRASDEIKTLPVNVTIDTTNPVRLSRRQIVTGLAAGYVVVLTGCTTNPQLGRQQLILVSDAQLTQMAQASWDQVRQKQRVSQDRALQNRVRNVGHRTVRAAGMNPDQWEFVVFENDATNAFVVPGGKVGFYTGMLKQMRNDDQIAAVMGHEVAHITTRHAAERVSQQLAAGVGLSLTQAIANPGDEIMGALGVGAMLGVILPYSRRHELEADRIGLGYMRGAGYNPREALTFWQAMAQQQQRSGRPPEILSTHPSDATRIQAIEQELARMGA
jgi:predicted Zn-dependent protease